MARFWLKVVKGRGAGTAIPVQKSDLIIGTGEGSDLRVEDDAASRVHSRIRLEAGSAVIQNHGQRNPTQLNSMPIVARMLKPGDRIKVGKTVLEWADGATASAPPYKWVIAGAAFMLVAGLVGLIAYRRHQYNDVPAEAKLAVAAAVPGFDGELEKRDIAKNPELEARRKQAREYLFHGDSLRVSGDLSRAMQQYARAKDTDPRCDLCKRRYFEAREKVIARANEYERAGLIAFEAGRYGEAGERWLAGAEMFHDVDSLREQRLRKRMAEAKHAQDQFERAQ